MISDEMRRLMMIVEAGRQPPAGKTFYHGTSATLLPLIQNHGLVPQEDPQSAMRGNWSTIPGYTERMIFLAPSVAEAKFYAAKAVEHRGGDGIVLAVQIYPTDPLRVTDDYIIEETIASAMGCRLTPEDYDDDMDVDVQYSQRGALWKEWQEVICGNIGSFVAGDIDDLVDFVKDNQDYLFGGAMTEASLRQVLRVAQQAFHKAQNDPWQSSLKMHRGPAVAFEGVIPAERIKRVRVAK